MGDLYKYGHWEKTTHCKGTWYGYKKVKCDYVTLHANATFFTYCPKCGREWFASLGDGYWSCSTRTKHRRAKIKPVWWLPTTWRGYKWVMYKKRDY